MLKIAICDDEREARETLGFALEKLTENAPDRLVYEFSSGQKAVRWLENHPGEIDLLFLDMEMKDLNGIQTAQAIREFDRNLMLAFVTGYENYVFEGYQTEAMDYLLKPVDMERLAAVLDRARSRLEKERERYFVFKNMDGIFRFSLEDIVLFYSQGRKVVVSAKNREYSFYEKLDQVENSFVRIHQRYLVNPAYVEFIGRNSVRILDKELPISRSLKDKALMALTKAIAEGGIA
jgi:two-component system response regulator LytT